MRRKIPSMTALLVFEATARSQSFTRAADELALTQSAVCRQIANLEQWLGVALFARVKKRVLLTPAGRTYAERMRGHLERIERDTLELMGSKDGAGVLELAVIPTFATQWLIPRLAAFATLRPDIMVNLSAQTRPFLFAESRFHAAIHSGSAPWPGTRGDYLMAEDDAIVVCSPALLAALPAAGGAQGKGGAGVGVGDGDGEGGKRPGSARHNVDVAQIAAMPLLHLTGRLEDWRHWFERHGLADEIAAVKGARHELFTMLIEAAVAGLGVALVPRYMVQMQLASGSLVQPLPHSLPGETAYYLVYPQERAAEPVLVAFRSWLLATVADTAQAGGV
jgi:DNA-binding transcriptional LysR family regulator